ncbi:MAG TPA: DMT family transporter [Streptosporangiaceae bacterium]|nr:DMT family transporter [Streptosporangiaceae bacterium]
MEARSGQQSGVLLSGGLRASAAYLLTGSLVAEVSFTLVAVPLLPACGSNNRGPLRASAYVSACSIPVLSGLAFATGGPGAVPMPTAGQAAAIGYLAVVVCAGGFYLLYSALPRLGADRVGLFAGLVPFGAMGAELLLGAGTIGTADVAGAVLVAAGVALPFAGGAGTRPAARDTREDRAETSRRKRDNENKDAAAPQQSRTRTGAPRA